MKFQDALLSDKIFNFIDIGNGAYRGAVTVAGKFEPQYVRSIGDNAFENNNYAHTLYFPYCKNIGTSAFKVSNYDNIGAPLRFGDVDTIKGYAFAITKDSSWGSYYIGFGNVGTIEPYAFYVPYAHLNSCIITFCNVGTIKTNAFVMNMFGTPGGKGIKFKNVDRIEAGAFVGVAGGIYGRLKFENVRAIADNAFSKERFIELELPDKFRTRAELVRIGVGNPDSFKID